MPRMGLPRRWTPAVFRAGRDQPQRICQQPAHPDPRNSAICIPPWVLPCSTAHIFFKSDWNWLEIIGNVRNSSEIPFAATRLSAGTVPRRRMQPSCFGLRWQIPQSGRRPRFRLQPVAPVPSLLGTCLTWHGCRCWLAGRTLTRFDSSAG